MDKRLSKHCPEVSFVRYADDVVLHCQTLEKAEQIKEELIQRLSEVKRRVNEGKTHVAYCKGCRRKDNHETAKFEFLGFSYQPRARTSRRDGKNYMAFTATSPSNRKTVQRIREQGFGGAPSWTSER